MKWLLERARYLSLIGVLSLLISAAAAMVWGVWKTYKAIKLMAFPAQDEDFKLVALFQSLDCFLVATAFMVIAISLYELFIGDLDVPEWMLVKNLHELKAKFGFVIIPVMAVEFLQKLLLWESALETMYYAIAVALVATALTAFNYVSNKEKVQEEHDHPAAQEVRAADLNQGHTQKVSDSKN